jgi:3'-phosphoadenosine 5'-phosphosulfate sulfotransferase (PAPS reductase)/FAD synthetase
MDNRTVSWFSCGAASAVATKLMLAEGEPITIAYCRVKEEHPDNMRFLKDCEKWFGQKIVILENEKYKGSCHEVFKKQFFSTPHGSPCTSLLKKKVRMKFQQPNDIIVFGYTAEEEDRLNTFIDRNNEVPVRAPLVEQGLMKGEVLAMIENAGIELPVMYKLGYEHNNCIGCVKGGMGYWNKIRVDFPEQFDAYAKMERERGYTILKDKEGALYLDELDPNRGRMSDEPKIECGIMCELAEKSYGG